MRAILTLSATIALGASPWAQDAFPAPFQGLWAETSQTCARLKAGQRPHDRSIGAWLRIQGTAVTGTLEGRFVSITERGSVVVVDEIWNTQEELTVLRDGSLRERSVGAGTSLLYRRCG